MKRSLNQNHVRQHIMQVFCAALGIFESTDSHLALGVFSQQWQVDFLGSLGGSLIVSIIQISTFLMTRGHYALIQEHPRWLAPVFLCTGVVFFVLHLILGTLSISQMNLTVRRLDASVVLIWILVQVILIDIGFCRIRSVVVASDKNSASTNKMLPQYWKIGRIVLCLNLVILSFSFFVAYALFTITNATEQAAVFSVRGLVRVLALYCAIWWTFHPPCPKPKERTRPSGTTASTSHPSSRSRHSYAPCSSSSAIPDTSPEPDPNKPLTHPGSSESSSSSSESSSSESSVSSAPDSSSSEASGPTNPSDSVIEITSLT
jgi:hypothetical protein